MIGKLGEELIVEILKNCYYLVGFPKHWRSGYMKQFY
jgi:hypothetical protein